MFLLFDLGDVCTWSRELYVKIGLLVVIVDILDLSFHISIVRFGILVSKFTPHRNHDDIAII